MWWFWYISIIDLFISLIAIWQSQNGSEHRPILTKKTRPIFRKLIVSKVELIKTNINKRCSPFRIRQFLNQILGIFDPPCIFFVTSNHQFCLPHFSSTNFSQFEQLKKKINFSLVQHSKKTFFEPINFFFSFSTVETEKNSRIKLGKTRLVDWWIDVTAR